MKRTRPKTPSERPGALLPLVRVAHLNLVRPPHYRWAETLGWQPIALGELHLTAHYHPLAIRYVRGEPVLGALLGTEFAMRSMVDESGAWTSGYMPSAVRCFPFQATGRSEDPLEDLVVPHGSPFIGVSGTIPLIDDSLQASKEVRAIQKMCRALWETRRALLPALDQLAVANALVQLQLNEAVSAKLGTTELYSVSRRAIERLPNVGLSAMARSSFTSFDVAVSCVHSRQHLKPGIFPKEDRLQDPLDALRTSTGAQSSPFFAINDIAIDDGELLSLADLDAFHVRPAQSPAPANPLPQRQATRPSALSKR